MDILSSITVAQIYITTGDIKANCRRIEEICLNANGLVVFPELATTGYVADDLLLHENFIKESDARLKELATKIKNPAIVGAPYLFEDRLYNAAFLLQDKHVQVISVKKELPNYEVFDEKRYFKPGNYNKFFKYKEKKVGVLVCADFWVPEKVEKIKEQADILLVINASPFHVEKKQLRYNISKTFPNPVIYVNQVGGHDGIVFDGGSFVMSAGKLISRFPYFEEMIAKPDIMADEPASKEEFVYSAIIRGLQDYYRKNGFKKIVIGLSGGIDSAVVAAIASEAIGSENLELAFLPSKFTSETSRKATYALAKNLGVNLREISIEGHYDFLNLNRDLSRQNIQSRIRGVILMAISNETDGLLLNTGNKSEIAIGYTTLYGDSCGGYAPISDVYKTEIYNLARWINKNKNNLMPDVILTRAPSAELKDNQEDQDDLLPYKILDVILKSLIEEKKTPEEISEEVNLPPKTIREVATKLHKSEFKRKQSPPGPKISKTAFGKDWRYPITKF